MEILWIDGQNLKLRDVVEVARGRRRVRLTPECLRLTARCRSVVDLLVEHNVPVYGLTTGFGSKRNVFISREDTKILQHNLLRSHASGIGTPLGEDIVRAALLLRANALCRGHSGLRPVVLEKIIELLNRDVYPWVPDQGSVSASGDLAPLSHLSLVLVGDPGGRLYDPGRRRNSRRDLDIVETPDPEGFVSSSPENLKMFHDYAPIDLEAKEGLALTNGVQVTCALGIMNAWDAEGLATQADMSCALSLEAFQGIRTAFDAEIARARPYPGQVASAANVRILVEGSSILSSPLNLAILDKCIRQLQENQSAARATGMETEVLAIAAGLETARSNPHGLARDNADDLGHGDPSGNAAFASDPLTRSLRRGLHPLQVKLQSCIRRLFDSEEAIAAQLREQLTAVADLLERAVPRIPSVQDDYSFRCASQVHGAARNALAHVMDMLLIEANSSTDNPLVFPPDGPAELEDYKKSLTIEACRAAVRSGGNFHGEPLALAMDYLTMAVAELGSISERRVAKIVDGRHNNGLPSLLIHKSGLNSGFMIPQYTAAALVSENKCQCFPASVDSIPTCENTEDHVSMGLIAARKTRTVIENVEKIIAIEFLTAFQALHFRSPFHKELGAGTQIIFDEMEQNPNIFFVEEDRILAPLIFAVLKMVRTRQLVSAMEGKVPLVHQPAF
ncbi:aromatic amino acid lyase [Myxococcota bacterium]|jgi:histidine ammonia-lyase|nr:aromatic amino acid lyase [Myxococcota bacterium]MBU1411502.1 aromatic amino acid lyase [Myxococcota bacterium]MBU1509166.1 aromatic amino acid lyase [Myxococcota bacterium]PKN26240.1 MAG: hypothetical protein CVU65_06305 [Deltaproteobacteria bacterium HGW-Deltaproteobacteria-22]